MVAVLPSGAMYYVWLWKNSGQSYREKLHGRYGSSRYYAPMERRSYYRRNLSFAVLPARYDPGVKTAETCSWRRFYQNAS